MRYTLFVCTLLLFTGQFFSQTASSHSFEYDGLNREYRLYVPQNYTGQSEVPLLLNLHGYTSDMQAQEVYGDFRSIADTANFIIIHPNGTLDNSGNRFWNAFQVPGVDDVGFLSALIDTIAENYSINLNRVYSTGMSNGGFMSYELACALSDKVTAVASVTGAMPAIRLTTCNPTQKVPAMQIHGTNDAVVPFQGNAQYASIPNVVDFWVNQNQVSDIPVSFNLPDINQNDNSTAEWMRYYDDNGKTAVEFFRVLNGGHTWPGAIISLPNDVTNRDFHASTEIWRFFRQHIRGEEETNAQSEHEMSDVDVSVFPNPSHGNITISSIKSMNKIQVFDVLGNKVLEEEVNAGIYQFHRDLKGVYFAQIFINQKVIQKKFIIH